MFLNELNKHSMIDQFNVVDVEKTAFDVSKVKSVPTIIVDNNRALGGRDAFAWLMNRISTEVVGVDSRGSAFAFIEGEGTGYECATLNYSQIGDVREAAPERAAGGDAPPDIQTALDRLKAERM